MAYPFMYDRYFYGISSMWANSSLLPPLFFSVSV